MRYKVTFVSFPGAESVHEHASLDEVFELMNQFKNDHPGCRMFRPFSDSIVGLLVNENGDIHGLVVDSEVG